MKKLLLLAVTLCLPLAAFSAPADTKDEPKGDKVEFTVHDGYFESNKSGLEGESSFLTFTDDDGFKKIFGTAVVMGKKPKFLPKDAFDKKIAVAVIHRGNKLYEYKVQKVTADEKTLYVAYSTQTEDGGGANFHSPMIVSVDKGKYTSVVFIENGKKAGTAEIGK
jgi:hypothetical protein